jgi:hypothetical protein
VVDGFKIFLSTAHIATIMPTGKESCMAPSISDLRLSATKERSPYRSTSGTTPSRFRDGIWSARTRPRFESGDMSPQAKNLSQRGSRSTASAPVPAGRFITTNEPPCASAICRLSGRPIPEPSGFVVKKGTKRFPGFMIPGPSS